MQSLKNPLPFYTDWRIRVKMLSFLSMAVQTSVHGFI